MSDRATLGALLQALAQTRTDATVADFDQAQRPEAYAVPLDRRPATLRAPTGGERLMDIVQRIAQPVAAQPVGRLLDILLSGGGIRAMADGQSPPLVSMGAAQKTRGVPTLYHSSPGSYQGGKLPFTAYYGNRDFVKSFPDEFGDKLYALRMPSGARVLDLTDDAAKPLVQEMARRQWGADTANLTRDDIYELWTDKALVSDAAHALGLDDKVDALKYGAEYIVPSRTIAGARTRVVK